MIKHIKTELTELQSKVIDSMRFPLVIGVIFIHMGIVPAPLKVYDNILIGFIEQFFSKLLPFAAVPIFFFFSGYLFFYRLNEKGGWNLSFYKSQMRKRFKTLIIPYFLWIIINMIVSYRIQILDIVKDNGWHVFWDYNYWGWEVTNWLGWPTPFSGPQLLPFWYLRDLIVVTICTPFIYYLITFFRQFGMLLLFICYISGIWVNISGFSIMAAFFFSLGSYLSINNKNIVEECYRSRWFFAFLYGILFIILLWVGISTPGLGQFLTPFYIITSLVTYINIASFIINKYGVKVNLILSNCTFFVYSIHTILILGLVRKILSIVNPWIDIINFVIAPFLCAAVAVAIYVFLRRYIPKVLGVLTGSRI